MFTPTDHKSHYETITVNGFPCLIVREKPEPASTGCRVVYWYGEQEKKARWANIRFIGQYFPHVRMQCIPGMDHAELVMIHPEDFYRRVPETLQVGA